LSLSVAAVLGRATVENGATGEGLGLGQANPESISENGYCSTAYD